MNVPQATDLVLLVVLHFVSSAQEMEIKKNEKELRSRVKVGMTADQVKSVLGDPSAIEEGLIPVTEDLIVNYKPAADVVFDPNVALDFTSEPDKTTWFYHKLFSVRRIKKGEPEYFINGIKVEKYVYDRNHVKDAVFVRQGEVVDSLVAIQYQILRDTTLVLQPVEPGKTNSQIGKDQRIMDAFISVLCVIFNQPTDKVKAIKAYYLYLTTIPDSQ